MAIVDFGEDSAGQLVGFDPKALEFGVSPPATTQGAEEMMEPDDVPDVLVFGPDR